MDDLLKQKPSQLPDERRALFALMDRYIMTLMAYKKEYTSLTQQQVNDIKQRTADSTSTLKKLQASQAQEIANLQNSHKNQVAAQNKLIDNHNKNAAAKIKQADQNCEDFEKDTYKNLNDLAEVQNQFLTIMRDVRKDVDKCYNDTDVLMGTSMGGKSKLEKIVADMHISSSMNSFDACSKLMTDQDCSARAKAIYQELQGLQSSFTSKLFKGGKINELIKELAQLRSDIRASCDFCAAFFKTEHHKRRTAADQSISKAKANCKSEKSRINTARDNSIKSIRQQMAKEEQAFTAMLADKKNKHAKDFAANKQNYDKQIEDSRRRWEEALRSCNQNFAVKMEEVFPTKILFAWMKQFWNYPRMLDAYPSCSQAKMNVLIGQALINMDQIFSGTDGQFIAQLMQKRYPYLLKDNRLSLPYTISIEEGTSLLISHPEDQDERVKKIANAIGMRLLRSVPPCSMRFLLIDPDSIGGFGSLMALDPSLKNNPSEPAVKSIVIGEGRQVYADPSNITSQIIETKASMDALSGELSKYPSLRVFNGHNPLSTQIYRPVMMLNFPLALDQNNIRTLNAMAKDCRHWGYSMVLTQPDKQIAAVKPEVKNLIREMYDNVLYIRMEKNVAKVMNSSSMTEKAAMIAFYGLPDLDQSRKIADQIRQESVQASHKLIYFDQAKDIFPEDHEQFTARADDGIVIPVGYLEGGQPFRIVFDDTHVHALIYGNTGSGKTNMLHIIMTNLMLRYSKDEVQMYLIDFKHGLDFRIYTQFNLPSYTAISLNNDPEFALAMLENLEKEQARRSSIMGSRYHKIADYNAANPGNRMCRILLIVDELYELVKQADEEIQKKIVRKLDNFVHQTRAFGIHLIISGQDLNKIDSFDTIKNQCITRIAMHCNDDQVKDILDEAGCVRMHSIDANDKGACVFSLSGGANPQIEHTAYMSADQQEQILRGIGQHYADQKQFTTAKVLLTNVSNDRNHIFQRFVERGDIIDINNELIIGEPMSMEYKLNLHPTGNVWVTGGSQSQKSREAAGSIMAFGLLSLILEKLKSNACDIVCTNCTDNIMRSPGDAQMDRFGQLASSFPQLVTYTKGDGFAPILNKFMTLMDRRRQDPSNRKPVWWFIARPELLQDLSGQLVIDFKELLQTGYKYNINLLVWNGDIKRTRLLQIERQLFKEKICLEMSTEDVKYVLDYELKPMPAGYKAVLSGNNTMNFRVYDLPDANWMDRLFQRIAGLLQQ